MCHEEKKNPRKVPQYCTKYEVREYGFFCEPRAAVRRFVEMTAEASNRGGANQQREKKTNSLGLSVQ